jgi:ubiquinone/menaquinone biosynthesis C-methylase UbiE
MEASVEELKRRARAMWAAGNFDEISNSIPEVGITVVDRLAIEPGMTVLDVACGTGNATIPAAVAGGRCTGLDLTPELFEHGRRHAAEAGVEIEWSEGDAEALQFASGSFDSVISTFGVMFAPRHDVAAAELARVVSPGGTIGLSCWTPEGTVGQMFKLVASNMPQPGSCAPPATLWGEEEYVRGLLEPHGLEVSCERQLAGFRAPTIEALFERLETNFGPWKMAQAALGDRWSELRGPLFDLYASASQPVEPSGIASFSEYLLVLARKPG